MMSPFALENRPVAPEELHNRDAEPAPPIEEAALPGEHQERKGPPLPSDVEAPTPTQPAEIEPQLPRDDDA